LTEIFYNCFRASVPHIERLRLPIFQFSTFTLCTRWFHTWCTRRMNRAYRIFISVVTRRALSHLLPKYGVERTYMNVRACKLRKKIRFIFYPYAYDLISWIYRKIFLFLARECAIVEGAMLK